MHTYEFFQIRKYFHDVFFKIDVVANRIFREYQMLNFQSFQCHQLVNGANLKGAFCNWIYYLAFNWDEFTKTAGVLTLFPVKSSTSNLIFGIFDTGSSVRMLLYAKRMPRIWSNIFALTCNVSNVANSSWSDILFAKFTNICLNSARKLNLLKFSTDGMPSNSISRCILSLMAFVYFFDG